MPNMNISPHHPDAALLWLESWKLKTGETLDGAFSADVVALGDLVTATGQEVPLPDGGVADRRGAHASSRSPGSTRSSRRSATSPARKAYQDAVTAAAFDDRHQLAEPRGAGLGPRRRP